MSLVKVRNYFSKYNMENRILVFHESTATVKEAAAALNTEEDRIAKSMSFKLKDGSIIIIVVSGLSRISNHKYKELFHEKARMLSHDEVEEKTGHQVGGVCPFAANDNVKIYLDNSLKKYETVFPACGSANSAIEVSIEELEKYSNYTSWIDITE